MARIAYAAREDLPPALHPLMDCGATINLRLPRQSG